MVGMIFTGRTGTAYIGNRRARFCSKSLTTARSFARLSAFSANGNHAPRFARAAHQSDPRAALMSILSRNGCPPRAALAQ